MKNILNKFLKNYFTNEWVKGNEHQYTYTCWNYLKDEIGPEETVLDAGCGTNMYKQYLGDNLWGIDITDIGSDEQITIEDFKTDKKFDVGIAFGSINFGDEESIRSQIKALTDALKPKSRIYWRLNPANRDHGTEHVNDIPFYDWSYDKICMFADEFGYTVTMFEYDGKDNERFFVKWERD